MPKDRTVPIRFENFSVFIDERKILDDVNLDLIDGVNVIYGPRGSGKSTLLRAVVKLNKEFFSDVEEIGKIFLFGEDLEKLDDVAVREKILYLDTSFIDAMGFYNFEELLKLSLRKDIDLEEFSEKLDEFGLLKSLKNGKKTSLQHFSPAERISLLLFIMEEKKPRIAIMDCILDHLDDETVERLIPTITRMKTGTTFVISTRIFQRFLPFADLLVIVKDGKISYTGRPRDYVLRISNA